MKNYKYSKSFSWC